MRNGNLIQLCSGRYYQGSGVLSHLGGDAVLLGRRALVVADAAVWPKVEARVLRSLEQSGVDTKIWLFSGHCCPGNVRSAAQAGQAYGAERVVGVGGGRALDTAKIAADHMPTCLEELGLKETPEEADRIFAFLAERMPVETPKELQRLRGESDVLFHGLRDSAGKLQTKRGEAHETGI